MSLLKLLSNTVEGTAQAAVGAAKLVVAPVTNLADLEQDHFGDAAKDISDGVKKIGKTK